MKIGILTYCHAWNYGAQLQAYSLCCALNEYEYIDAELIDLLMPAEADIYKIRIHKNLLKTYQSYQWKHGFNKGKTYLKFSDIVIRSNSIEDFQKAVYKKYDFIIAGSDEIWNTKNFRGIKNPYFLPGDLGCQKVSYAASGRNSFLEMDRTNLHYVAECMKEFSYIGVRDIATYKNVQNILGSDIDIHMNSDPSFLARIKGNPENGRKILKDRGIKIDKDIVGVMVYDGNAGKIIKRKFGSKYTYISLYTFQAGLKNVLNLTPFEWVDVISCLSFFITSYFHGTCFAILNHVPFHTIDVLYGTEDSKVKYILDNMGLEDCYDFGCNAITTSDSLAKHFENKKIDFKQADTNIFEEQFKFSQFIKELNHLFN